MTNVVNVGSTDNDPTADPLRTAFQKVNTRFAALGGAANLDVGTIANKIVQLDGSARLPAVDGSLLLNLPGLVSVSAMSAIGAWTPDLQIGFDSTGINYSQNDGFYYRVGKVVVLSFLIVLSSKGVNTGQVQIQGFPLFSPNSPFAPIVFVGAFHDYSFTTSAHPILSYSGSSPWLNLRKHSGGTTTEMTDADLFDSSVLEGSITYLTNNDT